MTAKKWRSLYADGGAAMTRDDYAQTAQLLPTNRLRRLNECRTDMAWGGMALIPAPGTRRPAKVSYLVLGRGSFVCSSTPLPRLLMY